MVTAKNDSNARGFYNKVLCMETQRKKYLNKSGYSDKASQT